LHAPIPHFGEIMALLAAFIFSWTSVFFTSAGQRLGVTTVNLLRLPGATLCLALTHWAVQGRLWPEGVSWADTGWIALSGIIGLAIGDSALFKGFTMVGPRRSMTVMALAPVFTVIIAWVLLGERLGLWAMLGILVVIAGVIIATLGKGNGTGKFGIIETPIFRRGMLLALVASAGQGLGSAFAKLGMTGHDGADGLDPLGATLIRLAFATLAFWIAVVPRLKLAQLRQNLQDRKGVQALGVAILMGPFISVWMSLVALKFTEAGIAQVLLGTVPIFVVLPSWLIYKDRPTPLVLLGTAVAVGGGALLFLR
jgi:drug/metabolite transporter (DMT)-like permease